MKQYYEALFLSHRPRTQCSISQFCNTKYTHSIFRTIDRSTRGFLAKQLKKFPKSPGKHTIIGVLTRWSKNTTLLKLECLTVQYLTTESFYKVFKRKLSSKANQEKQLQEIQNNILSQACFVTRLFSHCKLSLKLMPFSQRFFYMIFVASFSVHKFRNFYSLCWCSCIFNMLSQI